MDSETNQDKPAPATNSYINLPGLRSRRPLVRIQYRALGITQESGECEGRSVGLAHTLPTNERGPCVLSGNRHLLAYYVRLKRHAVAASLEVES